MSYVDLKTRTIVGADKGTKEYLHEEGHIIFSESHLGIKVGYKQQFHMYAMITAFIVGYFLQGLFWGKAILYASIAFLLLFWYYFIYEEVWCWNYAYKNLKGGKYNGLEKSKTRRS